MEKINISVVGLGLIGGSFARDLKSQINVSVSGVDNNENHCQVALKNGLVHHIISLDEAINYSNVIILALPVDAIESVLPSMLDGVPDTTLVIDVGSTKSGICHNVIHHPKRGQFVAAHPLAGTEFSGPEAAIKGLFVDAKNIICEHEKSDPEMLQRAIQIFESVGLISYFLTPQDHDKHLAYVSHLSHVTSFALGLTVLDIEKDEKQIFNLASTGFRSTSRLAKSNPRTWAAIFSKNKKYIGEALEGYIETIQEFKKAIANDDLEKMLSMMDEANKIKKILEN